MSYTYSGIGTTQEELPINDILPLVPIEKYNNRIKHAGCILMLASGTTALNVYFIRSSREDTLFSLYWSASNRESSLLAKHTKRGLRRIDHKKQGD